MVDVRHNGFLYLHPLANQKRSLLQQILDQYVSFKKRLYTY